MSLQSTYDLLNMKMLGEYEDAEEQVLNNQKKRKQGVGMVEGSPIDNCWMLFLIVLLIVAFAYTGIHKMRCHTHCKSEEACASKDSKMFIGGWNARAESSWWNCGCNFTKTCNETEGKRAVLVREVGDETSSAAGALAVLTAALTGSTGDASSGSTALSITSEPTTLITTTKTTEADSTVPETDSITSSDAYSPEESDAITTLKTAAALGTVGPAPGVPTGQSQVSISGGLTTLITTTSADMADSAASGSDTIGSKAPDGPNSTDTAITSSGLSLSTPEEKAYEHGCDYRRSYTCGPFNVVGAGTGDHIRQVGDVLAEYVRAAAPLLPGRPDSRFQNSFKEACSYFSQHWIGVEKVTEVLFYNYDYGYTKSLHPSPILNKLEYWAGKESMADSCPPTKINYDTCVKAFNSIMNQCDKKNSRLGGVAMDSCFKWTTDAYPWANKGNYYYHRTKQGYCRFNPGDPSDEKYG